MKNKIVINIDDGGPIEPEGYSIEVEKGNSTGSVSLNRLPYLKYWFIVCSKGVGVIAPSAPNSIRKFLNKKHIYDTLYSKTKPKEYSEWRKERNTNT